MIKTISITFSIVLIVLLFSSISWFELEQQKVEEINRKHIEDIEKLKKISQINILLENIIKTKVQTLSEREAQAENHLVNYFDNNADLYNFQIKKYIYNAENTKNLNVSFKLDRNNASNLNNLISMQYIDGFLQFKKFEMNQKNINGEIQLIQPYNGDNNAS